VGRLEEVERSLPRLTSKLFIVVVASVQLAVMGIGSAVLIRLHVATR
jgi:hypothetical protein